MQNCVGIKRTHIRSKYNFVAITPERRARLYNGAACRMDGSAASLSLYRWNNPCTFYPSTIKYEPITSIKSEKIHQLRAISSTSTGDNTADNSTWKTISNNFPLIKQEHRHYVKVATDTKLQNYGTVSKHFSDTDIQLLRQYFRAGINHELGIETDRISYSTIHAPKTQTVCNYSTWNGTLLCDINEPPVHSHEQSCKFSINCGLNCDLLESSEESEPYYDNSIDGNRYLYAATTNHDNSVPSVASQHAGCVQVNGADKSDRNVIKQTPRCNTTVPTQANSFGELYYFSVIENLIGSSAKWPNRVRRVLSRSKIAYLEAIIVAVFGFINKIPVELLCSYLCAKGVTVMRIENIKGLYDSFQYAPERFRKYYSFHVTRNRNEYINGEIKR